MVPDESPFASVEFARCWDGWNGRQCVDLEADGFAFPYVRRRLGPLYTHAALPFGIPIFVNDGDPRHANWIARFFSLGRSFHSSLSMYEAPTRAYPGVSWRSDERSVVALTSNWLSRVRSSALRKSKQASRQGWTIRELNAEEIAGAAQAFAETDRRHGMPVRFPASFVARLRTMITEPDRLRVLGAVRGSDVGGAWVIFCKRGYEVGWLFCTTDTARAEGVGPLLTLSWIEAAEARGTTAVDLGASPNEGVRRFKATFGARPALLHTGIRRWHLWGT